jgi:DNA-directed RNA polymerase specialized sigma24 family protein
LSDRTPRAPSRPPRAPGPNPGRPNPAPGADSPERLNGLVLAYREGQPDLLAAIYAEVEPILRTHLARHARRQLPASLETSDLLQQSWLILDSLARRWRPGGDFGAYVRMAFPWELARYLQAQSPGHRARAVRVDTLDSDALLEQYRDMVGVDGRTWDVQLVTAEALDELDPLARGVLVRHILEKRPFSEVARALRIGDADALRHFRRALRHVRRRIGVGPNRAEPAEAGPAGRALERLVRALHEGAGPERQLPGRSWACARTGISEARFARLVRLLVERGCIHGRTARQSGTLVDASPAETLARARSS